MKQKKDFSQLKKSKTKGEENKEKGLVRLMKLMVTLDRGSLNLDKASEELGVSRRTLLRDVKILQDAGIPIFKPTEQGANYRLEEGYSLPHFQVTKENALKFADTILAMQKFATKPFKMVSAIQKPALESGKKEQKKRKEKWTKSKYNLAPTNLTKEQFLSAWLLDQNIEGLPYETMVFATHISDLYEKEGRDKWYKDWQMQEAKHNLIHLNFIGQRYKNVLDDCKEIMKKEPKKLWPYKYAALSCYARKDLVSAIEYALNGLEQDKTNVELTMYLVHFFVQLKEYNTAFDLFNKVCLAKPAQVHFASTVYEKAGLFDKALALIEQALKKDAKNAKYYNSLKENILKRKEEKGSKQEKN